MKIVTASSTSSPAITFCAAVRVRQWTGFAEATCAAAGWRLPRAVSDRREALSHQLEELLLGLLAAILIAIFMIMAEEQS